MVINSLFESLLSIVEDDIRSGNVVDKQMVDSHLQNMERNLSSVSKEYSDRCVMLRELLKGV